MRTRFERLEDTPIQPFKAPEEPAALRQVPFMLQGTGEAIGVFAPRFPARPTRSV